MTSCEVVDVVIEIPYNSYIKYEYDEKEKRIRCDRVLNTSMAYPGNYGFIPNAISESKMIWFGYSFSII